MACHVNFGGFFIIIIYIIFFVDTEQKDIFARCAFFFQSGASSDDIVALNGECFVFFHYVLRVFHDVLLEVHNVLQVFHDVLLCLTMFSESRNEQHRRRRIRRSPQGS